MNVVFVAAGLYHHISEITDYLFELYGDEFHFFAIDNEERYSIKVMGNTRELEKRPYFRNINRYNEGRDDLLYWIENADVAIIGCGGCERYLHLRMKTGKLTFRMKERIFKDGTEPEGIEHYTKKIKSDYIPYLECDNLFYLCIGHKSSEDLKMIGVNINRMLRWGYFIYHSGYGELGDLDFNDNEYIKICWAGRFIKEKNPEYPLHVMDELNEKHIKAKLTYIGYGPLEEELHSKIKNNPYYAENILLVGPVSEKLVRKTMRKSDWFIFSSSEWEGWGVVLSEAMSEGLLCFASVKAGASKELISNGDNGFLFDPESNDYSMFVEIACLPRSYWRKLGKNARKSMEYNWDAKEAVDRLMKIAEHYINDQKVSFYEEGVCSIPKL